MGMNEQCFSGDGRASVPGPWCPGLREGNGLLEGRDAGSLQSLQRPQKRRSLSTCGGPTEKGPRLQGQRELRRSSEQPSGWKIPEARGRGVRAAVELRTSLGGRQYVKTVRSAVRKSFKSRIVP